MSLKKIRGIPHAWNLVIWGFWASALALIAFDFSDFVNYAAQAGGVALTASQQVFYYAIFPTVLYVALGAVAYLVARTGWLSPVHFLEAFLILVVVAPSVLAFTLPQASSLVFELTVLLGLVMSLIIGIGWIHAVKKAKK